MPINPQANSYKGTPRKVSLPLQGHIARWRCHRIPCDVPLCGIVASASLASLDIRTYGHIPIMEISVL